MNQEKKFYISKEKLEEIKEDYEFLKKLRSVKTAEGAPRFLESEDLNPEFVSFREDLSKINSSIEELENILKNAAIINSNNSKKENNVVEVGSKVLVEINGKTQNQFTIVGTLEAEPVLGKISDESPVGKALIGRKLGEMVKVSSPVKASYKIIKILS